MSLPFILRDSVRGIQTIGIADELFSKRKIFLTTELNAATSNELLQQLMYLEQEDPETEIFLYINSPGGDVISGLAVYDYLTLMKAPIHTICTGTAASMGSILFLAGDEREMLPHSKIMIHDPSFSSPGAPGEKPLEMQKRLEDLMKTRELLCRIIAERTGRTLDEVYEKTKEDSFFTAEEALEFGLATRITGQTQRTDS